MLFADTATAARIEACECRMIREAVDSLARARPSDDVFARPLAGGVAAYAGRGSPLNKVAGLGFGGPVDDAVLAEFEQACWQRGVPVQVELAHLADPAIGRWLTERGYRLLGYENVLARRLVAQPGAESAATPQRGTVPATTAIEVRQIGRDAPLDDWIATFAQAFASPDRQGVPTHETIDPAEVAATMRDMSSAPGYARYVAFLDGRLAGAASLRVSDGIAQFNGAATLPAHRRRGVQSALLEARLRAAGALGCDLAVAIALPGSKSHQNMQKGGFELLYTRAMLVRERPL